MFLRSVLRDPRFTVTRPRFNPQVRLFRDARYPWLNHEMATEWPATRVRKTFVEFFEKQCGHVNYVSSPVGKY